MPKHCSPFRAVLSALPAAAGRNIVLVCKSDHIPSAVGLYGYVYVGNMGGVDVTVFYSKRNVK